MDKHVERHDDELIELGVASVETKGVGILGADETGRQPQMGLSDD